MKPHFLSSDIGIFANFYIKGLIEVWCSASNIIVYIKN